MSALQSQTITEVTHDTCAEISDRLNFPAPSNFTRFFKRLTGLTPQAYRR